jgi:hypothetical protein
MISVCLFLTRKDFVNALTYHIYSVLYFCIWGAYVTVKWYQNWGNRPYVNSDEPLGSATMEFHVHVNNINYGICDKLLHEVRFQILFPMFFRCMSCCKTLWLECIVLVPLKHWLHKSNPCQWKVMAVLGMQRTKILRKCLYFFSTSNGLPWFGFLGCHLSLL